MKRKLPTLDITSSSLQKYTSTINGTFGSQPQSIKNQKHLAQVDQNKKNKTRSMSIAEKKSNRSLKGKKEDEDDPNHDFKSNGSFEELKENISNDSSQEGGPAPTSKANAAGSPQTHTRKNHPIDSLRTTPPHKAEETKSVTSNNESIEVRSKRMVDQARLQIELANEITKKYHSQFNVKTGKETSAKKSTAKKKNEKKEKEGKATDYLKLKI